MYIVIYFVSSGDPCVAVGAAELGGSLQVRHILVQKQKYKKTQCNAIHVPMAPITITTIK